MKTGRPSKYTPEHTQKFLEAIRKGATYELACNYARISYPTLRLWCRDAEENPDSPFSQFLSDLKEAQGSAVFKWLDVIERAAEEGEWTAAAWKLERRHFKDYSRHTEVIGLSEEMDKFKEQFKKEFNNGGKELDKGCD